MDTLRNVRVRVRWRQARYSAGHSGLEVACLTAVHEILGSNRAVGSCVYRKNHCDLQPWALAVCTLPAVPRSTQPFYPTWDGK